MDAIFAKIRELNPDSQTILSDLKGGNNLAAEWETCITKMLERAKESSERLVNSFQSKYNVNLMYFKGSGFFYDDKIILLAPDSDDPAAAELMDITKIAKSFANLHNSMTLIVIDGELVDMKHYDVVVDNF